MRAHVVVAAERGEAQQRRRNADGGEAGMAGRGIRAAVIHRGADGDAGGHLVVEQPADFAAEDRLEAPVARIVAAVGGGVNAAGEIAFEVLEHGARPIAVGRAVEKPFIQTDEDGDPTLVVGHEMSMTMSSDHRVVDGAMAAQYLQTVKGLLEKPASLLV